MLYKRGKIWWCEFMRGGKRQRVSTGLEDFDKAKQVADLLLLVGRHRPPRASVDAWLDSIYGTDAPTAVEWELCSDEYRRKSTASEGTVSRSLSRWDTLKDWCEKRGIKTPNEITTADASRWLDSLRGAGKTRKNALGEIIAVWNTAASRLPLPKNPFAGFRVATDDSKVRDAFTDDEVARIAEAAKTVHGGVWHLPVVISRWTGLRLSSIRALRWEEIDRTSEPWIIRHTPVKTARHGIAVTVPVASALRAELERIPQAERVGAVIHATIDNHTPFAAVMEAAGVSRDGVRNFHSLRHSFRTALAAAGVSDDIAKRLGGWTQNRTAQRYDHAERITEKLAAIEAAAVKSS